MQFPPDFTFPVQKTATAQIAAAGIAGLAPGLRVVVQAGGCSGLWALALAKHFERVYTFEPEPLNFRCLRANVVDTPNIEAFDFALGEARKNVGMTRPKPKAGLWRVDGDGDIPMVRLDDVIGEAVDAIVLDVEGSEVQAWQGAERLIAACRPLLWFEYLQHTGAIDAFLAAHGYTKPAPCGVGGDYYSVHASWMH